jgi:glutamate synthase (NADPH/NADH) large chain
VPAAAAAQPFFKYVILQIASGYFGWDEIIHAIPGDEGRSLRRRDQIRPGAKPGDGGLLMWHKVNKLIAAIRGVPTGVSLPSPPTHQTQYSIEESVAKMIQSMYMAWGFRVPVYPENFGHFHGHGGAQQPDPEPLCRRSGHRR